MSLVLSYLILGAAAGTIAGLFGLGGGIIIVPVMVAALKSQGVAAEVVMHMAIATSLTTIVLTSLSSIHTHHQKGAIRWDLFSLIVSGILIGSALGVQTAVSLEGERLQVIFGVFLLIVALLVGFNISPHPGRKPPGKGLMLLAGGAIGWLSALLGIGGGTLSVPFFTWCQLRMQQAVALAAACGLPIALAGSLMNIYKGWNHAQLPEYSLGYVYLPAVVAIALTSIPFARMGAKLSHRLPALLLKRAFALVLVLVGAKFIFF